MKTPSLIDDPTRASRYLADQLTPAERAEYEDRFLEDPEMVTELEATARLKVGLQRLREDGKLSELIAAPATSSPNRIWMLALAASIIAVVIGVGIWFPRPGTTTAPVLASAASVFKDRNGHPLAILATAPLFRTRAERYDAVIELPKTRGAIRLRVLPSMPGGAARYQAALARINEDDSSEPIVSITELRPSAEDGFVDVYADSTLLAPGRYRLALTRQPASSAGEGDIFVIKITGAN